MSNKWGKPRKNTKNRRDPRWHSEEYQIKEENEKDFGSNQENIEKLKQHKILKEVQSRTSYSDEETMAGVDDGRPDSLEETISNAIMDGWEKTLVSVIREYLPDHAEELLDRRGWMDLGHWDEPMLELAMKIRNNMMMSTEEDDRDYEFSRGFEENNNREEIE